MFKLTILLATLTLGFAQSTESVTEGEIITSLDLSNRSLENLMDYDFSNLTELESIDLSYNDLTFISDDQFRKNRKLKSVNLAGNPHLKVHKYSTFFIANIENLNISHCDIEGIYENSFDGLLNIKVIDLSYNPIEKNGINYHALTPLDKLREIWISQTDGPLFEEICKHIDLTIVVKSESNNIDIKCEDVRAGKLEAILPKPGTEKTLEVEHEVVTVPVVLEVTEAVPILQEPAKEESAAIITTPDNQNVEENTAAPNIIPPPSLEEKETESKKNESTETPKLNPPPVLIEEISKHENEIPKIEMANPTTEIKNPKNEVETSKVDGGESKMPKMMLGQETDKDGAETKVQSSESSSQPAAGTTVLVILVIAAVLGGLAAFGYKYYKSGKEDELEPVEKELQEITIDSKTNGAPSTVEHEPLIHQRKYSVEIKEVDEAAEDQSRNKSSQNGSSYIPITSVEKVTDEEADNSQAPK